MISIIVPVYKTEKYIRECIESIINQTYSDFELILVDDGSPDNCPKICDEYADKDLRIHVIHQKNAGVSVARNAGLDFARGEYIMFCDSDDYVSPNWCEALYKAVSSNRDAFIACDVRKVQNGAELPPHYRIEESVTAPTFYSLFRAGLSGGPCNKIFVADKIRALGLRFDTNLAVGEDVLFVTEYCKNAAKAGIRYVSDAVYYYRMNDASALHSYHENWLGYHLNAFYVRVPLIDKADLTDYCNDWLYMFINMFDNVFDKRSKLKLKDKFRYNQRMLDSEPFRFCLENCSGEREGERVLKILRSNKYYNYYIFQKLYRLKRKLKG